MTRLQLNSQDSVKVIKRIHSKWIKSQMNCIQLDDKINRLCWMNLRIAIFMIMGLQCMRRHCWWLLCNLPHLSASTSTLHTHTLTHSDWPMFFPRMIYTAADLICIADGESFVEVIRCPEWTSSNWLNNKTQLNRKLRHCNRIEMQSFPLKCNLICNFKNFQLNSKKIPVRNDHRSKLN